MTAVVRGRAFCVGTLIAYCPVRFVFVCTLPTILLRQRCDEGGRGGWWFGCYAWPNVTHASFDRSPAAGCDSVSSNGSTLHWIGHTSRPQRQQDVGFKIGRASCRERVWR